MNFSKEPLVPYQSEEYFDLEPLFNSPLELVVFREFLRQQLGTSYDYLGAISTVATWIPRDWTDPNRWYCSEILAAALMASSTNVKLVRMIEAMHYSCPIPTFYNILKEISHEK
jgi:hypothetical protein